MEPQVSEEYLNNSLICVYLNKKNCDIYSNIIILTFILQKCDTQEMQNQCQEKRDAILTWSGIVFFPIYIMCKICIQCTITYKGLEFVIQGFCWL